MLSGNNAVNLAGTPVAWRALKLHPIQFLEVPMSTLEIRLDLGTEKELLAEKWDYKTEYLQDLFSARRLRRSIELAAKALSTLQFDAIAFRGMSGALIASALSYRIGKPLIMVRKHEITSHSMGRVEGYKHAKTYVVVDDFISSGATVKEIQREIAYYFPEARCLGVLEFNRLPIEIDTTQPFRLSQVNPYDELKIPILTLWRAYRPTSP